MAPPTTPVYSTKSAAADFDRASASDDEDASTTSRSTWASTSDATILGYADGLVKQGSADLADWRISRIGGQPSFPPLTAAPSASARRCASCGSAMPLLTQIYCPLDGSLSERVVYTFACAAKACRGKEGTVRAWSAGVPWPEEEEPVVVEKEEEREGVQLGNLVFGGAPTLGASANFNPFSPLPSEPRPAFNPFAPPPTSAANPFAPPAVSNNPFAPPPTTNPLAPTAPSPPASSNPVPSLAALSLSPPSPAWPLAPSYPPHYLTTAYEPSTPSSLPPHAFLPPSDEQAHREGKGAGGRTKKGATSGARDEWGNEGYEVQKVRGVDEVFLKFQERVSREGKQVVRYDHTSVPLAYSASSPFYHLLFPTPNAEDGEGLYDPRRAGSCACGEGRTFEMQLMPGLVGLLNRVGEGELDWAVVHVFACRGECGERAEGWREEGVFVEWEE